MKLNKKGFTLVELLAVIIILAIVIGITIPAVLKTINSSRKSGGQDAAEIVANWIDDQYVLSTVDPGSLDAGFVAVCGVNGAKCLENYAGTDKSIGVKNDAFYNAAGIKKEDVDSVDVIIYGEGKSCVTLNINSNGNYFITANAAPQKYKAGRGCSAGEVGYYAGNVLQS